MCQELFLFCGVKQRKLYIKNGQIAGSLGHQNHKEGEEEENSCWCYAKNVICVTWVIKQTLNIVEFWAWLIGV